MNVSVLSYSITFTPATATAPTPLLPYLTDAAHGLPTETQAVVDTLAKIVLGDKATLGKLMSISQNSNNMPNNSINGLDDSLREDTRTNGGKAQGMIANKKVL